MIQQLSLVFAAIFLLAYMEPSHQVPPGRFRRQCWTGWYNRDSPSGTGDYEDLKSLIEAYQGQLCERPIDIQAVTADKEIPAEKTNQDFYAYNTKKGFICRNKDQKHGRCYDYKVRFKCSCGRPGYVQCCQ